MTRNNILFHTFYLSIYRTTAAIKTTTDCVSSTIPSIDCCAGHITISTTVTTIASQAFSGCAGLLSLSMPSSVRSIGISTFFECYSLSSINLPTSVSIIANQAFYSCNSLTSIALPSSLTAIGSEAFGTASVAPCNTGTTATLYVPASMSVSVYSSVQYSCSAVTYLYG